MEYRSFTTDRLVIRPCIPADAPMVLALLNSPLFIQYVGDRQVRSLEDATSYISERMLPQLERLGFGNYTLLRKEDGTAIGTCGLFDRPGLDGIDIGYGLLEAFYGKGYAFESACCLRDAAFQVFGIEMLRGITLPQHAASRRLLEKLGMSYRKMIKLPGDPEDLMLYELSKTEFKAYNQRS